MRFENVMQGLKELKIGPHIYDRQQMAQIQFRKSLNVTVRNKLESNNVSEEVLSDATAQQKKSERESNKLVITEWRAVLYCLCLLCTWLAREDFHIKLWQVSSLLSVSLGNLGWRCFLFP